MSDPETITREELAEAFRTLGSIANSMASPVAVADAVFVWARKRRELMPAPEYEPGEIYEDGRGHRYLRMPDAPCLPWLLIHRAGDAVGRLEDVPERPLRKLVPEGKLHAAVVRMIHSYRDHAVADPSWPYWKDIAADLEKLLEESDD